MLKNFRHVFDLSFFVKGILCFASGGLRDEYRAECGVRKTMLKENDTQFVPRSGILLLDIHVQWRIIRCIRFDSYLVFIFARRLDGAIRYTYDTV